MTEEEGTKNFISKNLFSINLENSHHKGIPERSLLI